MSFFSAVPLLQDDSGPLYIQLERFLRKAILDGSLSDNDALPPERNMAERYGISRLTVRKALTDLEREGLLTRRRGSGTFVSARKTFQNTLPAFQEDPVTNGHNAHSVWLDRKADLVTPDESMALGVAPGTQIYRFSRLRYKEAMPVGIEHSVLLRSCLISEVIVEDSLYAAMQKSGKGPVRALQRLRAVLLEDSDANLLGVAPGSPGLFMERRGFLKSGQTAELTKAWYRGDAADLIAEVSVPDLSKHTSADMDAPFAIAM